MNVGTDKKVVAMFFHVRAQRGKGKQLLDFLVWDRSVAQQEEPRTMWFEYFLDPACAEAFFVFEAYENGKAFEAHRKNKPFRRWDGKDGSEFKTTVIAKRGVTRIFEGEPLALPKRMNE